jgi:hypothetical protein
MFELFVSSAQASPIRLDGREVGVFDVVAAIGVAVGFVVGMSQVPEPARQRFNAILVAGAGAAYLSAGLGAWEFGFTTIATVCAYRGLVSYRAIGGAWLLHVGWDLVHHLYGDPIVWSVPTSSAQCAVCDTILAGWFFLGAPAVRLWRSSRRAEA